MQTVQKYDANVRRTRAKAAMNAPQEAAATALQRGCAASALVLTLAGFAFEALKG